MNSLTNTATFEKAKEYQNEGFSVIPICPETYAPITDFVWEEFQKRKPTEQELESWFNDPSIQRLIGIVTGSISNLIVIESNYKIGGSESEEKLKLQTTRSMRCNKGNTNHYFYWYYENIAPTIKAYLPGINIHGEGDFVVPIADPNNYCQVIRIAPLFLTQIDATEENMIQKTSRLCRSCLKKIRA